MRPSRRRAPRPAARRPSPFALAGLVLTALLLAAGPAQAGHTAAPLPDGAMSVFVLFAQVDLYAPAPVSAVDDLWVQVCAASAGQPVHCTYTPRECTPTDLALLCQL